MLRDSRLSRRHQRCPMSTARRLRRCSTLSRHDKTSLTRHRPLPRSSASSRASMTSSGPIAGRACRRAGATRARSPPPAATRLVIFADVTALDPRSEALTALDLICALCTQRRAARLMAGRSGTACRRECLSWRASRSRRRPWRSSSSTSPRRVRLQRASPVNARRGPPRGQRAPALHRRAGDTPTGRVRPSRRRGESGCRAAGR